MIQLRTLGQLTLEKEGAPGAVVLPQPKRLALLVYLATAHPSGGCARETLLALLWPELDDAHARTALRQALHGLRRALGADAVTGAGDERVGVDATVMWCDSVAFGDAVRGDPAAALELYGGPFLDGFHVSDAPEFERWVERERRRLELEAVSAARRLADDARAQGDGESARRWSERALALAPYDEVTFRHYLEILEWQADAAAAVQAYAAYERRMDEDLGLAPSPKTVALIERIRAAATQRRPREPRERIRTASDGGPSASGATSPGPPPVSPSEPEAERGTAFLDAADPRTARWVRRAVGVAAILAVVGTVQVVRNALTPTRDRERRAIAVLPFRDLSADSSEAYFAPALHEEILDRLVQVSSLRVVGRSSVGAYADGSRPLRQIAEDLGVGSVVEGSVEIAGGRMRVFVELLDPRSGEEVWAERYDRALDDAFAVQSEIATRIAAAVGVTLSGAEAGATDHPPQDAAAYRLYLQGLDYARRPTLRHEDDVAAQQLLESSLALDSTFGPAHALLSMVHWRTFDLRYDPTPERLALARKEADAARRLAPDLPETHLVTGITEHLSRRDYRGALDEFRKGVEGAPNDADLWTWIGIAYRPLGKWDSAFVAFRRARRLEPREAPLLHIMGDTYHYLHQYREAIDCYRQALALAPDFTQAHLSLAWSYILWQGQTDTLKALLASTPEDGDPGAGGGSVGGQRINLLLWEGKPDSALTLLRSPGPNGPRDPRAAATTIAEAEEMLGDSAAARSAYVEAEAYADSLLRINPEDPYLHASRGIVLGALGRRSDALREARFIAESDAYRTDRWQDGRLMGSRALVLAQARDNDDALVEIEKALTHPSVLAVYELRHSPMFDPIRGDPRFQALLREYAHPEAGHGR